MILESGYECSAGRLHNYWAAEQFAAQGYIKARSLTWPCQKRCQAEDDVTKHPNGQDHSCPHRPADCGSGSFGFGSAFHHFRNAVEIAEQPNNHQDVEQDQDPFEDFAEEAAFGLSQGMPTRRAVKGFGRNVVGTAGACSNRSHFKSLLVNGTPSGRLFLCAERLHRKVTRPSRLAAFTER